MSIKVGWVRHALLAAGSSAQTTLKDHMFLALRGRGRSLGTACHGRFGDGGVILAEDGTVFQSAALPGAMPLGLFATAVALFAFPSSRVLLMTGVWSDWMSGLQGLIATFEPVV